MTKLKRCGKSKQHRNKFEIAEAFPAQYTAEPDKSEKPLPENYNPSVYHVLKNLRSNQMMSGSLETTAKYGLHPIPEDRKDYKIIVQYCNGGFMSDNQSSSHSWWEVLLAILLGILAYGGLIIATGRLPWSWLNPPEMVRIEPYILLYSFLGSVAYLLSSLLGEYKLLSDEEKRLRAQKKEKEAQIAAVEASEEVSEGLAKDIERLKKHLEKFRKPKLQMLEIWIKLARIPFGMVMAAVFYLLAAQLVAPDLLDALGDKFLAGGAFVVAFFPKVMMEGLNSLADRLMGKTDTDMGEQNGSDESPP